MTSLAAAPLAFTTWDLLETVDCGNPIKSPQDYPDVPTEPTKDAVKDEREREDSTKFKETRRERRTAVPSRIS